MASGIPKRFGHYKRILAMTSPQKGPSDPCVHAMWLPEERQTLIHRGKGFCANPRHASPYLGPAKTVSEASAGWLTRTTQPRAKQNILKRTPKSFLWVPSFTLRNQGSNTPSALSPISKRIRKGSGPFRHGAVRALAWATLGVPSQAGHVLSLTCLENVSRAPVQPLQTEEKMETPR